MDRVFLLLSSEPGPRSRTPRAIIDWPKGLTGAPVIYPLGTSFEEMVEIKKLLTDRLRECPRR